MLAASRSLSGGREFLESVRDVEETSEAAFMSWLAAETPIDTPDLFDTLGTVLSHLDRVSACVWGCEGMDGDHLERHMIARTASNARAAIRLLLGGYLSEALALIRGMGEVRNLMLLFIVSERDLEQFRAAGYGVRRTDFIPRKVERKIRNLPGSNNKELRKMADISQALYSELSLAFTHFTRAWSPMTYAISRTAEIVEPYVKVVTLSCLVMVADCVSTALIFTDERLEQMEDRADARAANLKLIRAVPAYRDVCMLHMRLSSQGTGK